MTTTNFEGYAFRLTGLTLGAGSPIPTGTALERVVLTTRDLFLGGTDGLSLNPGEAANLLINGTLIATVVPQMRATLLTTDAGSFAVLVFSVGGNSYALTASNTGFPAATQTTAASVLNTFSVGAISPVFYGLQPEDANSYSAQTFSTQSYGSNLLSTRVGTLNLFDTDLVRGNAATPDQEILTTANGFTRAASAYTESLTTLQFKDGSVLGGVKTLQSVTFASYGEVNAGYFFDTAALAASGRTINDVAAVLNSFAFDHNLSWAQVGFTFQSGPVVNGGGDNVPPPPPLPVINVINGTARNDVLVGTSGRDAIRGFDGNDRLTGGADRDAFIFGTDTRSGVRSTDRITDYQVGLDVIVLEGAGSVTSIRDNGSAIVITLFGDGDRIIIEGAALTVDDITFSTSGLFFV